MIAVCKCANGHIFTSRVTVDEPEVNVFEVEACECPDCENDKFEVMTIEED